MPSPDDFTELVSAAAEGVEWILKIQAKPSFKLVFFQGVFGDIQQLDLSQAKWRVQGVGPQGAIDIPATVPG